MPVVFVQQRPSENEAGSGARHPRRITPMLISVRATAAYDLPEETFLLLMVEPPLVGPAHRVEQARLLTTPTPFHELGTDAYGNAQRRLVAPNELRLSKSVNLVYSVPSAMHPPP